MRLYLIPLTRTRTQLYCQRLNVVTTQPGGLAERITSRAARTWADWERRDRGWQRKLVAWGNTVLRRIPYQEWGLRSVPPASARRKQRELDAAAGDPRGTVEVVFPGSFYAAGAAGPGAGATPGRRAVDDVLRVLATEREALHRKKLTWCLIGMPFSIPFALVPL